MIVKAIVEIRLLFLIHCTHALNGKSKNPS
nr:MAG TPA: hypothetical protein [Caudoviricetes sp.]DAZ13632.1 MAG TPA: hypothetical protein [Caudoviricetes sp.]